MKKPTAGLLGLYLELYDHKMPEIRPQMDQFYATIVAELEKRGVDVLTYSLCRVDAEVDAAVTHFEKSQADCIITLHLSYSPSLQAADILVRTALPIIVLDTTPAYEFSPATDPAQLMFNHGIHGVQDLCNVLIQSGKPVFIEAGHWQYSDVLDKVSSLAKSARIAGAMSSARVGRIGDAFPGMGDFAVEPDDLEKTIGITVFEADFDELRRLVPDESEKAVIQERDEDRQSLTLQDVSDACHMRSIRAGLAVRRWVQQEQLDAITFNFADITRDSGLLTVPFLEASKGMARGIGYAGEGDALTAALVGSLLKVFPQTTFTEMFCPDWKNDQVFLSHMGEFNLILSESTPVLREMDYRWGDAENPAFATGRLRGGKAAIVNLAPGGDSSYRLIISDVEMVPSAGEDLFQNTVRGWFSPGVPVEEFLKQYSEAGGTHHLALVYGDVMHTLWGFGLMMGWDVVVIE